MAVASMHLGLWSWSRQCPELQTEWQNGRMYDFHTMEVNGTRNCLVNWFF